MVLLCKWWRRKVSFLIYMGHVSVSDPSIIENQPHELSIVYTTARIIWQWYIREKTCTVKPGRVWVMFISIHSLSISSFKSFKISAQGLFVSLFVSVNKTVTWFQHWWTGRDAKRLKSLLNEKFSASAIIKFRIKVFSEIKNNNYYVNGPVLHAGNWFV